MKKILLTGQPKSGKSYLLKKLINELQKNKQNQINGIITNELQFMGNRIGIQVRDINSNSEEVHILAIKKFHNKKYNNKSAKILSSYLVDPKIFEKIAIPIINNSIKLSLKKIPNLLIIDEIGKMELFSSKFKKKIKELFEEQKDPLVSEYLQILATVPISEDVPFVEKLKLQNDVEIIIIDKENRNKQYKKLKKIFS